MKTKSTTRDSELIVSKHSLRRADPLWAKKMKSMRRLKNKALLSARATKQIIPRAAKRIEKRIRHISRQAGLSVS